ncbi:MAG TPA: LemA family protein [Lacipirellulaceae bacterium]|jgi:LemA protein
MSTNTATPSPVPAAGGLGGFKWLILIGILVLTGLWFVSVGNNLVGLQEGVKQQWGQVETVLQRRFDLIPNLVATVKGYATHEQETLEEVTRLRSQWGEAKTVDEKAQAASALEGVLSRLLVVSENYPQLKADQNFRDLQTQLEGTENRVAVERQRYNETVKTYNTAVRVFPASLVASLRGFKTDFSYFEAARGAETAPKVDFSKPAEKGTG